jgi:hypothetical protein
MLYNIDIFFKLILSLLLFNFSFPFLYNFYTAFILFLIIFFYFYSFIFLCLCTFTLLFISVHFFPLPFKLSLHSRHISSIILIPPHWTHCDLESTPSLILLAVVTSHVSPPRYADQFLCLDFLSYLESWPVKMGPTRPETSVNNYHTTPCSYPEDNRFQYWARIFRTKHISSS